MWLQKPLDLGGAWEVVVSLDGPVTGIDSPGKKGRVVTVYIDPDKRLFELREEVARRFKIVLEDDDDAELQLRLNGTELGGGTRESWNLERCGIVDGAAVVASWLEDDVPGGGTYTGLPDDLRDSVMPPDAFLAEPKDVDELLERLELERDDLLRKDPETVEMTMELRLGMDLEARASLQDLVSLACSQRLLELAGSTDADEISAKLEMFIVHKNNPNTRDAYGRLQAVLAAMQPKQAPELEPEPEPEPVLEPEPDDETVPVELEREEGTIPAEPQPEPEPKLKPEPAEDIIKIDGKQRVSLRIDPSATLQDFLEEIADDVFGVHAGKLRFMLDGRELVVGQRSLRESGVIRGACVTVSDRRKQTLKGWRMLGWRWLSPKVWAIRRRNRSRLKLLALWRSMNPSPNRSRSCTQAIR